MKRSLAALCALVPLVAVSACGSSSSDANGDTAAGADQLAVTTSFYPLQYALDRIGGEHVKVTNLTGPGVEPHDLELTPKAIGGLQESKLVVYLSGFQPAVDDAVKNITTAKFDVADAAHLEAATQDDGHDHGGDTHAGEEHANEAAANDPHFWLDPTRYADVADAMAKELAKVDPGNADTYTANATALKTDLKTLDTEYRTGLKSCKQKDLVTSHAAFGYLAEAYGFHQVGISGLSPDTEPTAKQLADAVTHIKEAGASTVYAETLLPKDTAETVAKEAGAQVKVLDPIEGITNESAGTDYLEVMRSNLSTLKAGQECG
ncbi:metal ABC transporter substrate-binding protein [Kribbia dieselivorans]|uniref:metal ABC transporter substrate-binding protein n=1 Tax=Kribbia dieselivorans TaxID=331526 RepID=UPI00083872BC|nr:metal ABC transporter substrate-binding protein [Kribbia dieselivorans]